MKFIDWWRLLVKVKQIKEEIRMTKKWYISKTVWLNTLATITIVSQAQWGFVLAPELQGYILTGLNVLLRFITKEKIEW